ncbi:MAG TPA: HAD-IA family hydrolase [Acetivibrio sp.]|nr:HAD-IA family hydrolase [Clostridium sp.]HOQ36105.1 HAD-IA family hydrolase [Acetivibrio sp.]HPT90168.1 HAD-IA family hydrolase [Acetivibrio sp.]HQA57281.1 HAD-IA family hydrolase [Acetivibrio sp.]
MKKYKAVLFDFDYTLADSSKAVVECISYSLQKMGYPASTPESICRTIGLTLADAFRELTKDASVSNADIFRSYFKERADVVMTKNTRVFDTVGSVLDRLKKMGLKTGIVSTKFRYRIEDILKRDGLLHYFDIIIGGEDVSAHKPDPEGVIKALTELGIARDNVIFIGDSVVDARTAQNADVDFAAVLTGTTERDKFLEFDARAVLKDLSELPDFFESGFDCSRFCDMV